MEVVIGSSREFGAGPEKVGKDYSNVCFGVGGCHCRSSLWRSHGEGDRSLKASGGGAATSRHSPSVSPGLPPPHGFATGRIKTTSGRSRSLRRCQRTGNGPGRISGISACPAKIGRAHV